MEGKRLSDANIITRNYLDSILIEERLVDSLLPSLKMEFLGETFASPINDTGVFPSTCLPRQRADRVRRILYSCKELRHCQLVWNDGE